VTGGKLVAHALGFSVLLFLSLNHKGSSTQMLMGNLTKSWGNQGYSRQAPHPQRVVTLLVASAWLVELSAAIWAACGLWSYVLPIGMPVACGVKCCQLGCLWLVELGVAIWAACGLWS